MTLSNDEISVLQLSSVIAGIALIVLVLAHSNALFSERVVVVHEQTTNYLKQNVYPIQYTTTQLYTNTTVVNNITTTVVNNTTRIVQPQKTGDFICIRQANSSTMTCVEQKGGQ